MRDGTVIDMPSHTEGPLHDAEGRVIGRCSFKDGVITAEVTDEAARAALAGTCGTISIGYTIVDGDARPSLGHLREQCRLIAEGKLAASDAIQDAAPVLLEIAAAALARYDAVDRCDMDATMDATDRLRNAVAKVRS